MAAQWERPKLTIVLQFGHLPHKKVTTVPQIDKSFLGMSCTTRLRIRKVDRRSESPCAETTGWTRLNSLQFCTSDNGRTRK